jgi:hypothetical protein
MTGTPGWAWAAAVGVIPGLLAVDLAMSRSQPTMRRAVLVSAGWVAAAVAFGGILLGWRGGAARRGRPRVHMICTPAAPGLHLAGMCWNPESGRWPRRTNTNRTPCSRRTRLHARP